MNYKILLRFLKLTYTLSLTWGIGLFLYSCDNSVNELSFTTKELSEVEISKIYNNYVNRNFREYTNHIASCQGKPRFYREQMINSYKQQFAEQLNNLGKIDSIKIEKIDLNNDKNHAVVHIKQYYEKSSPEVILLQFIFTSKGWMIK